MHGFYAQWRVICAAMVLLASSTGFSQGILSGLFGRGNDQDAPPPADSATAAPAAPAGANAAGQRQAGASGRQQSGGKGQAPKATNAEVDARIQAQAQKTPDPKTVKEGARKIEKQIAPERIPSDLLKRYVGTWEGWFYAYEPGGRSVARQFIKMQAEMQGDGSLLMRALYFDKLAQNFVIGESYTYKFVDPATIKVTITRANNKTDTQTGHFNDNALFLTGDIRDGVEMYRERIDGNRLLSDGIAVYDRGKNGERDAHHLVLRLVRSNASGGASR